MTAHTEKTVRGTVRKCGFWPSCSERKQAVSCLGCKRSAFGPPFGYPAAPSKATAKFAQPLALPRTNLAALNCPQTGEPPLPWRDISSPLRIFASRSLSAPPVPGPEFPAAEPRRRPRSDSRAGARIALPCSRCRFAALPNRAAVRFQPAAPGAQQEDAVTKRCLSAILN